MLYLTHAAPGLHVGGLFQSVSQNMPATIRAPLVSIGIINWNYAEFVAEAIQSVKDQTYQNIECVILDNGSTDGSHNIIGQAIGDDPRFGFHRVPENLGHLGGALWLLNHLKGEFVTFLDADDVLLPSYVAYHLQVHLGASHATGFTSSNYLNTDSRNVVHTGSAGVIERRWALTIPTSFNPGSPRLTAINDSSLKKLRKATRYSPANLSNWGWGQGSSNMFRRSLLERFRPGLASKAIFGGVDGYFCPLINAVTGTLLIHIPLSLYRIHGTNDYANLPSLVHIRTGTARGEEQGENILLLIFSFLIGELDRALTAIPPGNYWAVLDNVASMSVSNNFFQHPGVKDLLTEHFHKLCEIFGRRATVLHLRSRMPSSDSLKIVFKANAGMPKLSDIRISLGLSKRYRRQRAEKSKARLSASKP
jgi:glycosyltransferase involved in cell wall biosynthesis